jgi:hypothetical protein
VERTTGQATHVSDDKRSEPPGDSHYYVPTDEDNSEDDDDSYSDGGAALRNLQREDGIRDSPDSSITSASLTDPRIVAKTLPIPISKKKVSELIETLSAFGLPKSHAKYRARSSIPSRMSPTEYARQCVDAALSSRLDPYALHHDEHNILQHKLCHSHVTVYLNIRNGILRLWVRHPSVSVNLGEAVGCAKGERWFGLACFAFEWLVRRGYINFGCVEASIDTNTSKGRRKESSQETIVIIGAGMAGLSCARQLSSLFQYHPKLHGTENSGARGSQQNWRAHLLTPLV